MELDSQNAVAFGLVHTSMQNEGGAPMIERVTLRYFKRFPAEEFVLSDSIVLAGPNNSGKTTLLQAIAVWNLGLRKWLAERPRAGISVAHGASVSKAKRRTGVALTRKDFTAIPLRELNLLWTDRSTALKKDELQPDKKLGAPRVLRVDVEGKDREQVWRLALEFTYQNSEQMYVKPAQDTPIEDVHDSVSRLHVVHVPPFSGIGAEETRYDKAYQDLLIGQGKPGDILRNLLLECYQNKKQEWAQLRNAIHEIFGYELAGPSYEGRPFIICEYKPPSAALAGGMRPPRLDISSAGGGFLQVLMLLGFFYARPASILLLDEPDAHLHIVLQKQVYDTLREIARAKGCQLLVATHSEVLVDATSPERIISFFARPHALVSEHERDAVREALKRLSSLDLLRAEQGEGVLYVEGESDFNLLSQWAKALDHPALELLRTKFFWHSIRGRNPHEARGHFFALKAKKRGLRGLLLLDGDNRGLPNHELSAEGLEIARWKRYETENYLVHPESLSRFVRGTNPNLFSEAAVKRGMDYLRANLPPAVMDDPLGDHEYFTGVAASKALLPGFFEAAGLSVTKNEYYQVAAQMRAEEIAPEVREKLNLISKPFPDTGCEESAEARSEV